MWYRLHAQLVSLYYRSNGQDYPLHVVRIYDDD